MAGTVAGLQARQTADDLDVGVMLADGLGDEVVAPSCNEGSVCSGKGNEAFLGQAAGRAHHQLLRHAHIVEPIRERIPENVDVRIFGQIRTEADDPVVFLGQLDQRIAEGLRHGGMIRHDIGVADHTLNTAAH